MLIRQHVILLAALQTVRSPAVVLLDLFKYMLEHLTLRVPTSYQLHAACALLCMESVHVNASAAVGLFAQ
jgi:hypothetical protein